MNNKNDFVSVLSKVTLAIAIFIISFAVFSLLAHEVVIENEDWFDSKAFAFFNTYSSPASIQLFKFFTFFGSTYFLFPAYFLMIGWLLYKHRKADAINVGIIAITSTLLLYGLKAFFGRQRPDKPLFQALTDNSFPSGHALSSFIFCSVLVRLVWQSGLNTKKKWAIALFLLLFSLVIGISRIALRYHFASDVLAGLSLGVAYVLLFFWLQGKIRRNVS